MMDRRSAVCLLLMLTSLSGCSSLLPSEHAEARSPFGDYLDSEIRYAQAIPGKTTRSELFDLGFDPLTQGNGRMLSFIDIRLMFVQANVPLDYLPDGLLRCLEAKDRCVGYAFEFNKIDSKRVGNFWADTFNFRKSANYRAGSSMRCLSWWMTCWCTSSAMANRTFGATKSSATRWDRCRGPASSFLIK